MRTNPNVYGAELFSLSLSASWTQAYHNLFREILGKDMEEGERHIFLSAHRASGDEWIDVGWLSRTEDIVEFVVMYGRKEFGKPPTELPKLEPVIRRISEAGLRFKVESHSAFRYEEGMEKSIIRLPIEMFRPHSSVLFDTIEGIEVARKASSKHPKCSVYITVDTDSRTLIHHVDFSDEGSIHKGYETYYLKTAQSISKEFLVKPETEE